MLEKLKKDAEKKRTPYSCCGGDPKCALNRTEKFIDGLFALYEKDPEAAKDQLFMYIESVETDRDWAKAKLKETIDVLLPHHSKLKKEKIS